MKFNEERSLVCVECIYMEGRRRLVSTDERVGCLNREEDVLLRRNVRIEIIKVCDAQGLCSLPISVQFYNEGKYTFLFDHHLADFDVAYIGCSAV